MGTTIKQIQQLKAEYPDAVFLFRVGDFYESYAADAVIASEILGIALTRRSNGASGNTEMAGFPRHALDTYLPKLVRAGKRVAICDQLENPTKRGISELVTPATAGKPANAINLTATPRQPRQLSLFDNL